MPAAVPTPLRQLYDYRCVIAGEQTGIFYHRKKKKNFQITWAYVPRVPAFPYQARGIRHAGPGRVWGMLSLWLG